MKLSRYLLPTLKETPADTVSISRILMLRAGMIRTIGPGIYTYLPLGSRVIKKIESIIRREMDTAGVQELLMPVMQPASFWKESDRLESFGPGLFVVKDWKNNEYCLAPSHEELITHITRMDISSYRHLPAVFYQIHHGFLDKHRSPSGIMKYREFIVSNAYSFDSDNKEARASSELIDNTYRKILTECGLRFRAAEESTGKRFYTPAASTTGGRGIETSEGGQGKKISAGGFPSHSFQADTQNGEETVLSCPACGYTANKETAECAIPGNKHPIQPGPGIPAPEEVFTPGKRTIEEVADFLSITKKTLIKTLIYTADDNPVALLIRGDHDLAEEKARHLLQCNLLLPADEETVLRTTGGPVGFSGPLGLRQQIPVIADLSVAHIESGVVGGNKKDTHLININPSRDFPLETTYADLKQAEKGMNCARCQKGKYEESRSMKLGEIRYTGTRFTGKMNVTVLDKKGTPVPPVMGCYSLGITHTMAAIIEQNHDENGIIWPMNVAPFLVIICPIGSATEVITAAETLYLDLTNSGIETLLDDRGERAGVMFKDADLIGIPLRVTVGSRGLKEGNVEVKLRGEKEVRLISRENAVEYIMGVATSGFSQFINPKLLHLKHLKKY
jgi:prolyl-tRNA synthetase